MNSRKNLISTVKTVSLTAIASALASGLASAQVVVDDFQSYATGELATVGSPPWTVENAADSTVVSDGLGNQYLTYGGTGDWMHNYRNAGGLAMGDDSTGWISFDVYATAEAADQAFGLTYSALTVDWYDDYGPYVRVTDDTASTAGVVSLDVRNGGAFVDDIATLNLDQWYTIRLNISTASGGTFDVYVDDANAYSGAAFRHAFASGDMLDTVLLMGGNGVGQSVGVDNITMDVVPEPSSAALLLGGLALLAGYQRSRKG